MKLLSDIVSDLNYKSIDGNTDIAISGLHFDSAQVEDSTLFIAIKGLSFNGDDFISHAIQLGASAIVCENLPAQLLDHVTYILVDNSPIALGFIASSFFILPNYL